MASLTAPVILKDWAFIPGPELMNEPTDSLSVEDISQHSAKGIAATLLAFPGTKIVHSAEPSWYQWKAEWQYSGRSIVLNMTLFNDEETWGGSGIEANCLAGDILGFWSFLQAKHTGIWLHAPNCTLHTQRSFLEDIATNAEQSAT